MFGSMKPEQRKQLLNIARQRACPGTGSFLPGLREESAPYGQPLSLPDLHGIQYLIVGGHAVARYMPPRMTADTDILVLMADLPEAERTLTVAGATRLGALAIGGSSWRLAAGGRLYLFALDRPWIRAAIKNAVRDEEGRPFAGLPYLVLMKLEASRLQDLADISRMLGCASAEQVEEARAAVSRYRSRDLPDLESMLALGRLEHGRQRY